MFERLLPRRADNAYGGHRAGLWLFALLTLGKGAMSLNSVFNGYRVATAADGIPLDTYTPAGARAVVSMFAAWGLAQLALCLVCVLVLARYRALVPFMLALLLLEHLCRRLLFLLIPVERTGAPPGPYVNVVLAVLMVAALALSLRGRGGGRVGG
ncbi:MAG TPA: hypothetical protein VF668_11835 [Pyrinomonadaceae bacterium]